MKKFLYVAMLAVLPLTAMAQHEEDTENGVVSLAEEQNTVKFEGLEEERISDSDAVISGPIS